MTVSVLEGLGAIAAASDGNTVDWGAVAAAAKAATEPGDVALTPEDRAGYAADVRDARDRVRDATGLDFDVPRSIEVQSRHHWIDANVRTFRAVFRPLEARQVALPGLARRVNSATVAALLGFLAANVLGQYDPRLLVDDADPGLYFVHPNLRDAADSLAVPRDRFRRWVAFHEVAHAAEFDAAPWLADRLEAGIRGVVEDLAAGRVDRDAVRDLDVVMTAVEGYAEFVMDDAFDGDVAILREKLDARRRGGGPLHRLLRAVLGLGVKRRQYERGREFFDAIASARGRAAAASVWAAPGNLPDAEELDSPGRWLARVDP